LCGRPIYGKGYIVIVDRAEVLACSKCVKKHKLNVIRIIDKNISMKKRGLKPTPKRYTPKKTRIVEEIVEDYAELIREAREAMGLTKDVLAAMVGEKVSVIRRIEDGSLQPSIPLARKLEKVLKIKLIEEVIEDEEIYRSPREYEITLGDIVEFKGG